MDPDRTRMTATEQLVWDLVRLHRGRTEAIRASDLCRHTGLEDRQLRDLIAGLVLEHGCRIASTPERPAGYFVPLTVEESLEACASYRSRALKILKREATLRGIALRDLVGQLALELKETPDADPVHVAH